MEIYEVAWAILGMIFGFIACSLGHRDWEAKWMEHLTMRDPKDDDEQL